MILQLLRNLLEVKKFLNKIILELKNKIYFLIIILLNNSFYLKLKNQKLKRFQDSLNSFNREEVDVIIPVFNAKDYVEKCLESIFICKSKYFINLIIINDASDLETREVINKYFSNKKIKINVIHNSKNIGYTKSVNKGIRASKSKYVVIANSDILVVDYWVDRLIRGVLSKKRVGIVGPLTNAGGFQSIPEIFNQSGELAINKIPLSMDHIKFDNLIERDSLNLNPEIKFINGFCHLITRDCIEEVGLLDEKNFPVGYGEEVDYSIRALSKKFKILVVDNLYIYHHKTKSFKKHGREKLIRQANLNIDTKYGRKMLKKLFSKNIKNIYLNLVRFHIIRKIKHKKLK